MTSIDDALPIARSARQDALTLKSKQGDDDGGTAFRKAFADIGKPQESGARTKGQTAPKTEQGDRTAPTDPQHGLLAELGDGASAVADDFATGSGPRVPSEGLPPSSRSTLPAESDKAPTRLMKNTEALVFLSRTTADKVAGAPDARPLDADTAVKTQGLPSNGAPKGFGTSALGGKITALQAPDAEDPDAGGTGRPILEPSAEPPHVAGVPKAMGRSEAVATGLVRDLEATPSPPVRKGTDPSWRRDAGRADASSGSTSATSELLAPAEAALPSQQADLRTLMALLGPAPVPQPTPAEADMVPTNADMGPELPQIGPAVSLPSATKEVDAAATTDAPDQIFRLARQDSRTSALYLRGGIEGGKTTSSTETSPAKVENVTVLDARRYLGIAPTLGGAMSMSPNAQAVAQAVAQSAAGTVNGNGLSSSMPDAAAGLSTLAGGATGKVVNTLKIQMHPIDLGLVTATLRLRGDDLQIDLRVRTGEAFRQLSDDQDAMIKALQAQGFQVDQVNVVYAPADSGAGNDAPAQQGNQQPSQPGRDGQSGFAPGGGSRNGHSGQSGGEERRLLNDIVRETASPAQPGLSDDLYL